eukprot:2710379-Karenia_brevis.AAC.1
MQIVREVEYLVGSGEAKIGRQAESHEHSLHTVHAFIFWWPWKGILEDVVFVPHSPFLEFFERATSVVLPVWICAPLYRKA